MDQLVDFEIMDEHVNFLYLLLDRSMD